MEKVIAVVVTYNRQKLLSECISALKNQSKKIDKIFVVNNGSTDDTQGWLKQQSGIDFITQPNCGGAGGFNAGINYGYKNGYSWIWVMDDDGYPKEDALEKLLEEDEEELCMRNCAVLNKEDKKSFVWKTKNFKTIDEVNTRVIKNVCYPFNGTLLHRKIVERVGLPKASLFLWGDETEYYYRIIRKNKIPFYTVTDSIHYHPATAFTYKADWNFGTGWKMYYYLRNRFHILKSKFGKNIMLASIMYVGFLILFAGTIVAFQKTDKLKKLRFIFWPATDAFANNLKATPETITKRLTQKSLYTFGVPQTFIKNFKTFFSAGTHTAVVNE
jgi:GT2 family glycosyltransferase